MKINCYDARCKYCDDNYKCTNKHVVLGYRGVHTKFQGFKHLLECESFEEKENEWYLEVKQIINKLSRGNKK